ncbi:MAG: hypothetical protein WCY15_10135 [Phenylobacterium sp.]|jgi:hypothetical protein|uniref:hypothetical protein n=1 Tax=Phenylobacterium sp. TaxID=1871053 RepID=UPI002A3506A5|nr:hypothetical protein [Phenylobacterium sp.]MDD3836850.1 hypothetical protein [Phenylobacterium sp.]MDX9998109.1 hypothetical protein [Phenylobacterium sp.]
MRSIAIGLAIAALVSGPALAKDAAQVTDAASEAAAQASAENPHVLYVCDRSKETRRGFKREFGAAEFTTAERASSARGEAWSAPRCISRPEMMQLKKLQSASLR